ncbi:uncharacterized protein LOC126847009 [Adelges cooleyi]|uniref:uncharacterized protein LOC126847009 n=1 Tax=Adelges cooleyi TaxID=133065 RepID=UPI00217FFE5E|nr:uncharacterized protein LOC126847009 [Adelges cooleyi]
MTWKITFLLACLSVLVIAPNTPGESSGSNENQQECLEKLYRVELVRSLNDMPTLAETDVHFEDIDIKYLTEECDLDTNCLNRKEASVSKYRRKMEAIQCIHGLFVLKVMGELRAIEPVSRHQHYLKNMLSLLNIAQWNAYEWQIEVFTFVEGLAAPNVNLSLYREHFRNNYKRMWHKPFGIVRQCVQEKYLLYRGEAAVPLMEMIARLVDGVYSQMELLYRSSELDGYRNLEFYTVKNLMLRHIYTRPFSFSSWSMYGYQLDTNSVTHQLFSHAGSNVRLESDHSWELDPIGGNKYNDLISKCIHLRLVHFVWLHLHIYHTIRSRPTYVHDASLSHLWNTLVPTLKIVLRMFRFKENIYWSALHIMMDDLENISLDQLAAREKYTRNYFCYDVDDMGLASASDIDRQLNEVQVSEDYGDVYDQIYHNSETLNVYIFTIGCTLLPLDGTFIRIIVSAERNETLTMS